MANQKRPTAILLATVAASLSIAQISYASNIMPEGYFPLTTQVTLVSGDTWKQDNKTYRLYGVQSCLRGTTYTNANNTKTDCGDTSLAVFAAYIKDTGPFCAPVAVTSELTYVTCYSTVGGKTLDLSNILIIQGFAFASINSEGLPVVPAYQVSEQVAATKKAGLWSFKDVQHPAILIAREWKKRNP